MSIDGGGLIAHVLQRTGAARPEPAAETPVQAIALINVPWQARVLRGFGTRRAEHQQARNAERVARHVAPEADERALELRWTCRIVLALVERVEHDALGLVVRRHFEKVAAANPAERHAVVEEQRARVLLRNALALQADPREHQQLRIDRKLQRLER